MLSVVSVIGMALQAAGSKYIRSESEVRCRAPETNLKAGQSCSTATYKWYYTEARAKEAHFGVYGFFGS
jgi:hypothetical protein